PTAGPLARYETCARPRAARTDWWCVRPAFQPRAGWRLRPMNSTGRQARARSQSRLPCAIEFVDLPFLCLAIASKFRPFPRWLSAMVGKRVLSRCKGIPGEKVLFRVEEA